MNVDLIQLLYCAGFAVLGWWLRHRGLLRPGPAGPTPSPAPSWPVDQKVVLDLLKSLLDRLGQAPPPAAGTQVVHVPIEVAAKLSAGSP